MNGTARWVEENWKELDAQLDNTFKNYFHEDTIRKDIEDWKQSFLTYLIERDIITRYMKGHPIPEDLAKKVSYWGFRYVCHLINRQGMDLISRLYTKARTEKGYRKGERPPKLVLFDTIQDIEAPDSADEALIQNELSQMAEMWVKMCFPRTGERYALILQGKMEGRTVEEIGSQLGVSRKRAASMLSELRQRLRYASDNPRNFIEAEFVRVV